MTGINGDTQIATDWFPFTDDTTKTLLISAWWGPTTGATVNSWRRGGTGIDTYYLVITSDSNDGAQNPSSTMTDYTRLGAILKIETK